MHTHKSNNLSFSELRISTKNQRDDSDVGVGIITRQILRKFLDDGDITDPEIDRF